MTSAPFSPSSIIARERLADDRRRLRVADAVVSRSRRSSRSSSNASTVARGISRRTLGDLPSNGDVYLRNVAGVPIVLVRDDDGAVRGFLNVCRHRSHPVVIEVGNRKVLQCHYHGWKYRLDGSLLNAPA